MTSNSSGSAELSDLQKKTLILHGLFCPPLTYVDAFNLLGSLTYPSRQDAARRLEALGLMQSDNLTSDGWEMLAKLLDPRIIEKTTTVWRDYLKKLTEDRNREAAKWVSLSQYLYEPYRQPEPIYVAIDAPAEVVAVCTDYLKNARLCVCVGAWAGAIAYCSLAVEHLLLSVLTARGIVKAFDDVPALQELNGEVGKHVPEVGTLTKRIVQLIANFRNDSVHPRDPRLRPGENQARNVYDLTARFMADVKREWFSPKVAS